MYVMHCYVNVQVGTVPLKVDILQSLCSSLTSELKLRNFLKALPCYVSATIHTCLIIKVLIFIMESKEA